MVPRAAPLIVEPVRREQRQGREIHAARAGAVASHPVSGWALVKASPPAGLDPHSETIYRHIIRTQHQLNRPDATARTLALLTTKLAEIDAQPNRETAALIAQTHRNGPQHTPT